MPNEDLKSVKLKRVVKVVTVLLLIVLIGLTITSRAIFTSTLPRIETANVSSARLRFETTVSATIGYTDTTIIRAENSLQIVEVYFEINDYVQEGDPLLRFNLDDVFLMEQTLEHQIWNIERIEIPQSRGRNRESLVRQKNLLSLQLEMLTSHNLENGLLLAPAASRIVDIYIEQWQNISAGDELFLLTTEGSKQEVFWYMDEEASKPFASEVRSVFMYYDSLGDDPDTRNTIISNSFRRWDMQKDMYRYSFLIEDDSKTLYGIRGEVHMSVQTPSYSTVVPLSAVLTDLSGVNYIFVTDTREGLFGLELFVRRVNVLVLEKSEFFIAVDAVSLESGQRVVTSSSQPLFDGNTVWSDTLGIEELHS